jgi:putative FmdB family regulatory protein
MPIFEYRCRECGTKFERIVGSSETVVTCKNCESRQVDQLLSVFAVARSSGSNESFESGPCGACGAPERGMCTRMDRDVV